jgi:hypothetical protein
MQPQVSSALFCRACLPSADSCSWVRMLGFVLSIRFVVQSQCSADSCSTFSCCTVLCKFVLLDSCSEVVPSCPFVPSVPVRAVGLACSDPCPHVCSCSSGHCSAISRSQVVLIRFVFSRPRSQVRAVSFVRATHALRSVPFHVHGFRLVLSASYTQVRILDSHFQFVLSIHALNFVLSEMCFWCSADSFYQVWALSFVRSSSCSQVCLLYVVS